MDKFNPDELQRLFTPAPDSHKGQNGKVLIIAGSTLFHAAALWPLEIAAHIADMVFFASVSENNEIVRQAKRQFRNGIVVPRDNIGAYIQEADTILIGPGLPRPEGREKGDDDTRKMTKRFLMDYPEKRWVIDGGSLQVMDPLWIPANAILTPHSKEFKTLFSQDMKKLKLEILHDLALKEKADVVLTIAKKYHCIIVLKGQTDIVCSPDQCVTIPGGNAGMTKGGTGDVLAGMAASLYAKNDAFLAACASSYFNKKAAEMLFETKGYWYSTTDLIDTIPKVMKKLLDL